VKAERGGRLDRAGAAGVGAALATMTLTLSQRAGGSSAGGALEIDSRDAAL